jgi:hypothetical protein
MAFAFVGWQTEPFVHGQTTNLANPVGDDVFVMGISAGEAGQRVIVFDKSHYTLAVYEVDTLAGRIALRSVRHVRWDLSIDDFNSLPPKPDEVRAMMEDN